MYPVVLGPLLPVTVYYSIKIESPIFVSRIDRKIEFPLPDEKTKRRIFGIHTGQETNLQITLILHHLPTCII